MPVYAYECPKCSTRFDNYWDLEDFRKPTPCPECETIAVKDISSVIFHSNERGGFKAGYHPGLGEHVSDRADYSRKLKAKGMVEVGTEKGHQRIPDKKGTYLTDDALRALKNQGAEFSDGEAAALKKGKKLHKG